MQLENDEFNPLYYNTLDQIYHYPWVGKKLAKQAVLRETIQKLWPNGHPTKLIQVVGTSGKGSVCRYLEAGFALRHKAGALNSPHVFDFRERFSLQKNPPTQSDIIEAWEETIRPVYVDQVLQGKAEFNAYYSINILIALVLFEKYGIEWAAIEAGMGGRYDLTTALDVAAVVMTNVGKDHEHLLGSETWQRALDKAGACRRYKPTFSAVQDEAAFKVLQKVCHALESPLYHITEAEVKAFTQQFNQIYAGKAQQNQLLSSGHQIWNATLSLRVLQHFLFELKPPEIISSFAQISFTGRLQEFQPGLYIDIAHNPNKIAALLEEVQHRFHQQKKIFVVGLSGQRSPQEIFSPVLAVADAIVITAVQSWRRVDPETIHTALEPLNERQIPIHVVADPPAAIAQAQALQQPGDVMIVTGSTFVIDQALNPDPYIRHINATYKWRYHSEVQRDD